MTANVLTPRRACLLKIHIHFKVYGRDLQESAIERAVQMSAEKILLRIDYAGKAAKMSHSFEIVETE